MFIDQSYFTGPLEIAQLGQKAVIDRLNIYIERYESEILEAALGYDFSQALTEGFNPGSDEETEQRWLDILNGVAFTNTSGIKKKFKGLKFALAGFIFYEYMAATHKQVTGIGVQKAKGENSETSNPANILANAWNTAAKEMELLWEFLQAKTQSPSVYPEYDPRQVNDNLYWNWDYPFSIYNQNYMNPIF